MCSLFGATDEAAVDDRSKSLSQLCNVKDLDNKKFMLEEFYSSGPILINFWTLSCEPCKKEMKHLTRINEKYKALAFDVVNVNMDTPRTIKR